VTCRHLWASTLKKARNALSCRTLSVGGYLRRTLGFPPERKVAGSIPAGRIAEVGAVSDAARSEAEDEREGCIEFPQFARAETADGSSESLRAHRGRLLDEHARS
jgi:hypothetical protein